MKTEDFCDWLRRARDRLRFRAAPQTTLHPAPRAAAIANRATFSLRTRKSPAADPFALLIARLEAAAAEASERVAAAERAAAAEATAAEAAAAEATAAARRSYSPLPSIPEEDDESYFSCSD